MSKWISVKDELPPIDLIVDVYGDNIVTVGKYNPKYVSKYCCGFWDELNKDMDGNQTDLDNVTHWRYRPEPPK